MAEIEANIIEEKNTYPILVEQTLSKKSFVELPKGEIASGKKLEEEWRKNNTVIGTSILEAIELLKEFRKVTEDQNTVSRIDKVISSCSGWTIKETSTIISFLSVSCNMMKHTNRTTTMHRQRNLPN